jgi:hypothetical protein
MSYRTSSASSSDHVVVDLSAHMAKLTAYEDISDDLSEDAERKLVSYIKACMEMSHARISRRYDSWREADEAHDVYVRPDATEFREKAVIADTRAIADTVLTYFMAALFGRNPMFQLEGLNRDSRAASMILERVLHQQMRRTAGEARLAQLLLDNIRYGAGPTKAIWDPTNNQNRIVNINPRRWFPDPRTNWTDLESQQFVGLVDWKSYSALARSGSYPKLTKYPDLRRSTGRSKRSWSAHKWNQDEGRGLSIDPTIQDRTTTEAWKVGDARVVDEFWFILAGYEINVPSIKHIHLVATVIDESVVIRLQLNPYGRMTAPMVVGSLYSDAHKTFGQSLYDVLMPLHNIATWLLRSRVDNVQAALTNLIFVDPAMVSVPDLIDRNPWGIVRTLNGTKPGDGVHVAQVPDVTRGHWNDIMALGELKQRVSAASDAQQGIPTPDVRSATEIARLTQLGSQRLGVLSRITSATTIRPLVNMLVSNIQDALAFRGSVRIDQDQMPSELASFTQDGYIDYDAKLFQGDVDYMIIDGTLPIEPTRSPETWINMLKVMSETGLNMEYDMGKMAEEAIRAMGITDLERFRYTNQQRQQQGLLPNQQLSMLEKMRGASVQPAEQISREVERGNLVPMRGAQ